MHHQGSLQRLPQKPAHLALSHQSAIMCGPVKITPPSGQEITFNLNPADIQKVLLEAATRDMTNTMQVMGTLNPSQAPQQNPFAALAAALHQTTRQLGHNASQSTVASTSSSTTNLPNIP